MKHSIKDHDPKPDRLVADRTVCFTLTSTVCAAALMLSACASTPEQTVNQSLTDEVLKERISEAICIDELEASTSIVWQSEY